MRKRILGWSAITLLAGALASSCGSNHSSSTVSPTPAPAPQPGPSAGGAAIAGTLHGVSGLASVQPAAVSVTVTVVGTSISSAVDGSGRFRLTGVPPGDVQLEFVGSTFRARVTLADVADRDDIRIVVVITGGGAEVEEDEREKPDNKFELEGLITNLNLAARTLQIGTNVVSVPTTATIRRGGTPIDFSQLGNGDRVHVKGSRNGTTLVATEVKLQNPGGPGPNPPTPTPTATPTPTPTPTPGAQVEVKGTVSGKTGACPTLTFTVASTVVTTDGNTKFKDASCGSLANGDKVEVKGTRQANGSVLATSVERDDEAEEKKEVELQGAIAGKSGTCPKLSFTVASTPVVTDGNTRFSDTSCTGLANGDKVEVKGTRASSTAPVLATRVEKKK